MNFIVKLFPEITIKSGPVRKRMSRQLTENLRIILKRYDKSARVTQNWDNLEVSVAGEEESKAAAIAEMLACVPGIANFSRVRVFPLVDLQAAFEDTLSIWKDQLEGKTFCVRVKRNGQHDFSSIDAERYIGGGLNQHTDAKGVDLHNPDEVVKLEIRHEKVFVVDQKYEGQGGFPIGSQESVVSLVSGGFDSTVASYHSIKRGLRTHFLFFNLGGAAHELGVKEIAFYLWNKFGSSHRVKFISVPFDGVVNEILEKVDPSCMGVILKRMMLRAATKVAERAGAQALVTGEAVAQVSSQTLTNLSIIDRVSDALVLRPLAMMDKGKIIAECRRIGAEDFSAGIPEYCGVISVRPSAHLRLHKVEAEELKMREGILEEALESASAQNIDAVMKDVEKGFEPVETVDAPSEEHVVIDIRHPNEVDLKPLKLPGQAILNIPFYSLNTRFDGLDASKVYLLYCDKGVMSQLHANHLKDAGHKHIGVFKLIT